MFAMLLVSCVTLFGGIISPKLPFSRHTGLHLPWKVQDEETGYGFSRPNAVLANWRKRVMGPRFRVESWMEEHPAVGALLFEVLFDVEM